MIEEENKVKNKKIIERFEDSYICYNCSDLYLCSHNSLWVCHGCSEEATFDSYPYGGLSPSGISTLRNGINDSKFDPSELENSNSGRVVLLNKDRKNNTECKLWAVEGNIYDIESDSLINLITRHLPVYLVPYKKSIQLEKRFAGIVYPPIVSINGRGFLPAWRNHGVQPEEWINSGTWSARPHFLLSSLLQLEKELFANSNHQNVVIMLVFGEGKYSEIEYIPRALRSFGSSITDLLFIHKDPKDFNDNIEMRKSKFLRED